MQNIRRDRDSFPSFLLQWVDERENNALILEGHSFDFSTYNDELAPNIENAFEIEIAECRNYVWTGLGR